MSTWQIFSDAGKNFRWEISDEQLRREEQCDQDVDDRRLPSMADLLLQGYSRLLDNEQCNLGNQPMFRTGLGKTAAVKQSSIARTRSVLADVDNVLIDTGQLDGSGNKNGLLKPMFEVDSLQSAVPLKSELRSASENVVDMSNSMFQTGSGKKVNISSAGLLKAKTLLAPDDKVDMSNSLFQTGSGKAVNVSSAGLLKAKTLLALDDKVDMSNSLLQTGSDKAVNISSAGLLKAKTMLASEERVDMSNSLFQTGSGKAVNISSAGLLKAKTLLGLEENYDPEFLHGSNQTHKRSISLELLGRGCPSHFETENLADSNFKSFSNDLKPSNAKPGSCRSELKEFSDPRSNGQETPPIKFQTAGGRSISVSSDALQQARSLLRNPEFDSFFNEERTDPFFPIVDAGKPNCPSNQTPEFRTPFLQKGTANNANCTGNFTSPLRLISHLNRPSDKFEKLQPGNNLITKFDAVAANATPNRSHDGITCDREPLKNNSYSKRFSSSGNGVQSTKSSSNGALVDITNTMNLDHIDNKQCIGEKRRNRRISSVSSFKKPRSSFVTPLNKNNAPVTYALSRLAPKETGCKERVSVRYPLQVPRTYLKEYIVQPPVIQTKLENLPQNINKLNPLASESFKFQKGTTPECIGPMDFYQMLSQCGASNRYLTKEWVLNHYKWIVWKLASYERCYSPKFSGKALTVTNVLEELKYRYEREVNHGHRSAIKKILDGDALPSSMMILCISSVGEKCLPNFEPLSVSLEGDCNDRTSYIELTDGWYSVKAQLDALLSQKLATGKLFLGQKLRICGAKLCGWIGPISPLEASETSLLLHINGTYRCHWAERLGFCKSAGLPLAFRCIKGSGGAVPITLVGATRIYPVLYKEKFSNGSFIVRPERVEAKVLQCYNQRRDAVAEGIISGCQMETEVDAGYDHDSEEGAKLMKLLETAAEPEVIMAGMSSNQLTSFALYKAKLEATRQSDMQKSIEKALEDAGLSEREVTPFLRVQVVGLTEKCHPQKCWPQRGLITIWNPTEKQTLQLREGQAYAIGGLVPSSSESGTLYLQARGSNSSWLPLSPSSMEEFKPFFTPRSSVTISNLGEVPLSSEFDIAALVVYVGEVYAQGHQHKQWVFLTDGSPPEFFLKESSEALLAINFCLPYTQHDSFSPVNSNLEGSVVGFCNLIKRPKDQANGVWVADATENADYFLSYDHAGRKHLKDAAASVSQWANSSSSRTEKLKETVVSIIRSSKDGC